MSAIDIKTYEQKRSRLFYVSFLFFLFTIIGTGALYGYTKKIESDTNTLISTASNLENSIQELRKNPQIQAFEMYSQNKKYIEQKKQDSKIPLFIAHLKKIFRKYNLEAKNFKYANNTIQVEVTGQTNDAGYAYEKGVSFLRGYNQEAPEDRLFQLNAVQRFEGYDTLSYAVEFETRK